MENYGRSNKKEEVYKLISKTESVQQSEQQIFYVPMKARSFYFWKRHRLLNITSQGSWRNVYLTMTF